MSYSRSLIGALVVLSFIVQPVGADQSVYKGKNIKLVVPERVGSFTDRYNRIAARQHVETHSRYHGDRGEKHARSLRHGGGQLALQVR